MLQSSRQLDPYSCSCYLEWRLSGTRSLDGACQGRNTIKPTIKKNTNPLSSGHKLSYFKHRQPVAETDTFLLPTLRFQRIYSPISCHYFTFNLKIHTVCPYYSGCVSSVELEVSVEIQIFLIVLTKHASGFVRIAKINSTRQTSQWDNSQFDAFLYLFTNKSQKIITSCL